MSENNTIKEELEKIEPAEGARERMLENIKRKAAEQNTENVRGNEKKPAVFTKIVRWVAPIAACLAIAAVGIVFVQRQNSVPIDSEGGVQIANPLSDEMTADELREKLGIEFKIPENAENTVCYILDGNIGDVRFEADGKSYYLRFSRKSGDFSGIFGDVLSSEIIDAENNAVLEIIGGVEKTYKISWTNGEITFILSGKTDEITKIYEQIK